VVTVLACRREKACGLREGTVRRGERGRALSLPPLSLSLSLSLLLHCTHGRRESDRDTYLANIHCSLLPTFRCSSYDVTSPTAFLTATDRVHVGGTVCDLAKACDCVNRENLLAKLLCYGIRAVAEDWLTNRRQNVEEESPNSAQNCFSVVH